MRLRDDDRMLALPPEVVANGDVVIRRWSIDDADALHAMIDECLEHLRPWMGWVQSEPLSIEERRSKIHQWDRRWNTAEGFAYAITHHNGDLLGACGLHVGPDETELGLGYWIRSGKTGRGFATQAAAGLIEAALSIHGVDSIGVAHDRANTASRRVPEKLGFTLISERDVGVDAPNESGVDCIWKLERMDWRPLRNKGE